MMNNTDYDPLPSTSRSHFNGFSNYCRLDNDGGTINLNGKN